MKTIDYCRALKKKLAITSDYQLAKQLGLQRQTVSHYVNGHRAFDQPIALRVAEILEISPEKVIADMELERASSPELQEVWKRIAKKVAFVGGAAIGTALLFNLQPGGADSGQLALFAAVLPNPCVLCKVIDPAHIEGTSGA